MSSAYLILNAIAIRINNARTNNPLTIKRTGDDDVMFTSKVLLAGKDDVVFTSKVLLRERYRLRLEHSVQNIMYIHP